MRLGVKAMARGGDIKSRFAREGKAHRVPMRERSEGEGGAV